MLSIIAVITFLRGGLCHFIINVCKTILDHQRKCARDMQKIKMLHNLIWALLFCATLDLIKIKVEKKKSQLLPIRRQRKQADCVCVCGWPAQHPVLIKADTINF